MPNEYGRILLQQIEQQRQQRLRQRAEERGLPIPPDEQIGSAASAPIRGARGGRANLCTPGSSGRQGNPPESVHADSSTHASLQQTQMPAVIQVQARLPYHSAARLRQAAISQ